MNQNKIDNFKKYREGECNGAKTLKRTIILTIPRIVLIIFIAGLVFLMGCNFDINVPKKQGFYGTVYKLSGTMKKNKDGYYDYSGSEASPFPGVKITVQMRQGGKSEDTTTNSLGNYVISVKPPVYLHDDSTAQYYIDSAELSGLTGKDKKTYKAFVKIPFPDDKSYYSPISVIGSSLPDFDNLCRVKNDKYGNDGDYYFNIYLIDSDTLQNN